MIGLVREHDEIGEEWRGLWPNKRIAWALYATLGEADATCAVVHYEDGWIVVGVGNPLRPFTQFYEGESLPSAMTHWVRWVLEYYEGE